MDKVRGAVGPISSDAQPATSSKALGPTASQILMPLPALPKRDTALPITDPSPSPTPVQLTGPSPISLPIVSRKKKETSEAATAA